MSPRTFVTRGAALVALALGIAACETKTIVSPPPADVQVSVTPASATLSATGQTVQFVALVTGVGTNGSTAVTWKSSNTAAATVTASGNTATVTAVANGTATIIATSTQDPTRSGAGLVTVQITGGGGGNVPPTVSIASITTLAGGLETSANTAAIQNTIVITANVDQGTGNTINAVNFNLGGKTICSQTLTQGKSAGDATVQSTSAVSFACQVKTDSTVAGVPVYPNGNYTLTVSVVGPANAQLASASQALTFANVDAFGVTASGAKTATASSGLIWQGGTLTVVVTPKVFNTETLAKITVTVGGVSQTQNVTTNAALNFTFRADTAGGVGLLGIMGDPVNITVSGVTSAGQPFSGNLAPGAPPQATIRYDDQGPTVGTPDLTVMVTKGMSANSWLNATALFSTGNFNTSPTDNGGVGGVTSTFQFSTDGGTTWTTDSTVAQLGEQAAASVVARVVSCDKLGNCTNSAMTAAPFGVDLTPPVVQSVTTDTTIFSLANLGPKPTPEIIMSLQSDNLSGFGNPLVKVQIIKDSATATGGDKTQCISDLTLGTLISVPSAGCPFLPSATSTVAVPAASGNGYFTMAIYGLDQAGNKTATTTKVILVDRLGANVLPVISITSRGLTGNIPNVSATINDNVDLGKYQPFAEFAGAIGGTTVTTLPMAAATVVHTFGTPVVGQASPSATLPFSSVEATLVPAGAVTSLANVGFQAFDVAGNAPVFFTKQSQAGGTGTVTNTDVISTALVANPTAVCESGVSKTACTGPAITATTTTLAAAVTMANDVSAGIGTPCATVGSCKPNPITAVYFYTIDATTNTIGVFLGSATASSFGINTANLRVFTYTVTANASQFPGFGAGGVANTVFVVGTDASGNGVFLGSATVTAY